MGDKMMPAQMATPGKGTERTHEEMLNEKKAKPAKKKMRSIEDLKAAAKKMKPSESAKQKLMGYKG